jgi:DNA-binding Xre family transcriptional regulator/ribosomal protein S15P/S13E
MTKATRSLIASEIGIERARKALIDLGINQTGLEERLGFSRSTISSFFNRTKPIDHPYFTKICKTLNLEWEDIIEKDNPMKLDNCQIENTTDLETNSSRLAAFVIEGSFPVDDLTRAKIQALVKQLQKITGDASLEIVDIQEGSIKIILKGTPEALSMIQNMYSSGKLDELVKRGNLSGANTSILQSALENVTAGDNIENVTAGGNIENVTAGGNIIVAVDQAVSAQFTKLTMQISIGNTLQLGNTPFGNSFQRMIQRQINTIEAEIKEIHNHLQSAVSDEQRLQLEKLLDRKHKLLRDLGRFGRDRYRDRY